MNKLLVTVDNGCTVRDYYMTSEEYDELLDTVENSACEEIRRLELRVIDLNTVQTKTWWEIYNEWSK